MGKTAAGVTPTLDGYAGTKKFTVIFHEKSVEVCAPDEQSAIVTAAKYWNRRWTDYEFYAWCRVFPA